MLKTKVLLLLVFLVAIILFVFKINQNNGQDESLINQEKENFFDHYKNDFLSLWRENDKKIIQVLKKERENQIPQENKIIKDFSVENKISEILAIRVNYPLNMNNLKWAEDIKPGMIIFEASDENKLKEFKKSDWQKNILCGLDLSKLKSKYNFTENMNFLKSFDFVILPQISYFMNEKNYVNETINLKRIIFSLQENKTFVFLGNYPTGLNPKKVQKVDWNIYKTLITQIPFLGLMINNVEVDEKPCLFNKACVGDEMIADRLKITSNLFDVMNNDENSENGVYWQVLKNSDMIYLEFDLKSDDDFKNLKNLKNEMELDYYKNDGVKTVVLNSLKKLIKFKLDWGFQYD